MSAKLRFETLTKLNSSVKKIRAEIVQHENGDKDYVFFTASTGTKILDYSGLKNSILIRNSIYTVTDNQREELESRLMIIAKKDVAKVVVNV